MSLIELTKRPVCPAAPSAVVIVFVLGVCVMGVSVIGVRPADAGCGAYIHFRGSPSMAVNPVARVTLSALAKDAGREAGLRFTHDVPSEPPAGSESPAGEEGCHGPNCSKQRSPYLPQPMQVLLLHLPDGIVLSADSGPDAPTSATLVAEYSSLPQQYSLGIFRPPRC
ncbi:MAG: hypothetical protein U1A77_18415 [Pirellulales bacterium]|jgi:hypothetical protein